MASSHLTRTTSKENVLYYKLRKAKPTNGASYKKPEVQAAFSVADKGKKVIVKDSPPKKGAKRFT